MCFFRGSGNLHFFEEGNRQLANFSGIRESTTRGGNRRLGIGLKTSREFRELGPIGYPHTTSKLAH